nr:MAG TPA: hypothetical protein [Caudoviricetes sp.]
MTRQEIMKLANIYADEFAESEDKAIKHMCGDCLSLTQKDYITAVFLANAYYACKCGMSTREETSIKQRELLS